MATTPDDESNQGAARAALAAQIASLVNSIFAERRQVVLLSYLGQVLRKHGYDFREILGEEKLADFIRRDLSEKVRIVATPAGPLILAAVPADVDLETEIDPFGKVGRSPPTGPQGLADRGKRDLLARPVWFAFSHTLDPAKARVLRLEPVLEYVDYEQDGEKPEGFTVPNELIVPVGSAPKYQRDELIYQNIRTWAAQNGVPFKLVLETQTERPTKRSVLDSLIAALSDSDLSRISMPLDVIAKLRRKPH